MCREKTKTPTRGRRQCVRTAADVAELALEPFYVQIKVEQKQKRDDGAQPFLHLGRVLVDA